ncbi:MAG: hypothetical protein OQK82_06720 [Candidatus Pacearchaeota archaeon]|nr:hypothetical protein [Candidatus Pacearchaeota archaeon]
MSQIEFNHQEQANFFETKIWQVHSIFTIFSLSIMYFVFTNNIENNYIGFSFMNKASSINNLLENYVDKIAYFGDAPEENDKPISDLAKEISSDKLKFIKVLNPANTLRLIKTLEF